MKKIIHRLRFEKKYILDYDSAFFLKQRVSYIMSPDDSSPDGLYHVSSLYFDDMYNTSFFEKQNSVLIRDKFRARFYNNNTDKIRFERKHKYNDMTYKDVTFITYEQYISMCNTDYGFITELKAPVFEKFYTVHILKQMRPVIMIRYNRQAYTYPVGNIRITFDSDISASLPSTNHSFSVLPQNKIIMEIKYDHFIPSLISELLTGVPFTQQLSISKFSMSKKALRGNNYIGVKQC